MNEQIIKASTGNYGRVYVVVPISAKESMMEWMKRSGFKKSHFFRTALMIGTVQLAEKLGVKDSEVDHFSKFVHQADPN